MRQEGHGVENATKAHLRPNYDPGDEKTEKHRTGGHRDHKDGGIDERPGARMLRDGEIVFETHAGQRGDGGKLEVRQERCPKKHEEWDEHLHGKIEHTPTP